jgi:hypothetical protein
VKRTRKSGDDDVESQSGGSEGGVRNFLESKRQTDHRQACVIDAHKAIEAGLFIGRIPVWEHGLSAIRA